MEQQGSVLRSRLNNSRLLFDLRVIDVGVIITRATELQGLFVEVGRDKQSYGSSTTHLDKLLPRMEGGGGGGCPVVAFAIKRAAYIDDRPLGAPAGPVLVPEEDADAE